MSNTILLVEPYYAGSHKQMMDILYAELKTEEYATDTAVLLMTLPGKKWHWRARTSALYFAQTIPEDIKCLKCIFASCVLPLHELLGLRPDLQNCKKVVYFHENQLVYPVRKSKNRDFQYGYNQIMTCLAADVVVFNSKFNQDSFLGNIKSFFKLQPDCRPKNLRERIEPKCKVLYYPLKLNGNLTITPGTSESKEKTKDLRIVWPHRWEFDKNPELFFRVLYDLLEAGITNFRLNVLGESFTDNPPVFEEARIKLASFIDHFGYVAEKEQYYEVLKESDIIISTADHEFFGVSMLEGVTCYCFPLAPNKLVYPEIFPFEKCLYTTEKDLLAKLTSYLKNPETFKNDKNTFFANFTCEKFEWKNLKLSYMDVLIK